MAGVCGRPLLLSRNGPTDCLPLATLTAGRQQRVLHRRPPYRQLRHHRALGEPPRQHPPHPQLGKLRRRKRHREIQRYRHPRCHLTADADRPATLYKLHLYRRMRRKQQPFGFSHHDGGQRHDSGILRTLLRHHTPDRMESPPRKETPDRQRHTEDDALPRRQLPGGAPSSGNPRGESAQPCPAAERNGRHPAGGRRDVLCRRAGEFHPRRHPVLLFRLDTAHGQFQHLYRQWQVHRTSGPRQRHPGGRRPPRGTMPD